jgi:hypothetical protein
MSEAEFFNGFGNRFLWTCAQRSKILPDSEGVEGAGLGDLITKLHQAVAFGRQVGEMEREPVASELWKVIYQELAEEVSGLVGEVLARGDAQMLRLSMIYALQEHSQKIAEQILQAARALWRHCEASACFLFGDRLGNPKAEKIFAALQTAPKGMTRSEIHRSVFKGNLKVDVLEEALRLLHKVGWIDSTPERTAGRDAERFFLKSPTTKETKETK